MPSYKRLCNAGKDKGLPIGNLTSQFFANVYLNELDQFVKHQLKCRHYLRYVDDFILLHAEPAQLNSWKKEIEKFLAQKLCLALKEQVILQPVNQGANFLGYIVRPDYLLIRKRVVGNLWEKLACFEQKWIKGSGEKGWILTLLPEPRDHLRSVLASYWGHFKHGSHYRLGCRMFYRFPWLHCLFLLINDAFVPLWQPHYVTSYKSQQRFFCRIFPNARIAIQCGCSFDQVNRTPSGKQKWAISNPRFHVSKVVVRQQGYLKGGLRRRCVESLTIPPISQTGVILCGL